MRGTRHPGKTPYRYWGIIPAHAGNTVIAWPVMACERDHPRACGEHLRLLVIVSSFLGSSPRMRGTPHVPWAEETRLGIIPAHAGNTPWNAGSAGEGMGSSPRMRGTLGDFLLDNNYLGDHPRACGEHNASTVLISMPSGSSPRMRGTRFCSAMAWRRMGIIPAHAGNTSRCR